MRNLLLGVASAALLATAAGAQSLMPNETFSSIAVEPLSDPNPVLGTDDRMHLAYELKIANPSKLFITIDKVEAVDPAGAVLSTMTGDALAQMTTRYAGDGNVLGPGQTSIVFMDVALPAGGKMPDQVLARLSLTRQDVGPDGKPIAYAPDQPIPGAATFTGAAVKVGAPARRIAAPLRGGRWLAVNGCCDRITSHRGAVIAIDGKQHAPERFAIDWIRLDQSGRMFAGDGHKLGSFPYYGVPIYSVADGVVVNTYDEADEQVPLEPARNLKPANIGGNMMVVDIGGGAYAFYAHLQRGSLKAKLGDHVKAGQVLGLLGNTGNTDAPHLHFHLMDGTVPLNANGLPFVLNHFTSEGVLAEDQLDPLFDGKAVTPDKRLVGSFSDRLPLNNQVTTFAP